MIFKLVIKHPNSQDIIIIKKMWVATFKEDSEKYVNWFFANIFNSKFSYCLYNDTKIISVVNLFPKEIIINNKTEKAFLIGGIMTLVKYQRKGYMKYLLQEILKKIEKNHIVLIQAYNWNIYKSFNFITSHKLTKYKLNLTGSNFFLKMIKPSSMVQIYEEFMCHYNFFQKRNEKYFKQKIFITTKDGGQIIYGKNCYAFISNNLIFDYAFMQKNDFIEMLSQLKGIYEILLPINIKLPNSIKLQSEIFMKTLNYNQKTTNNLILEYI